MKLTKRSLDYQIEAVPYNLTRNRLMNQVDDEVWNLLNVEMKDTRTENLMRQMFILVRPLSSRWRGVVIR